MKQGWEYKKLGDCFPYIKNGANIKQIKDADGLSITRIETLSGGVFNRDRMGYAGIYNLDKYSDYVLEDGDLLMSHINSKTYIGRTVEYRAKNGETIIHGMNLLRLKSNSEIINSSYFAYYTLSNDFKANVAKVRKDAVNQSSIAISDIKRFSLPVPSIQTQQYVVDELDKINELIRLKKEQLRDYDKLAQSLFYEMFGDPIENEKGWEVKKLKEFGKVVTGNTPSRKESKYYSEYHIEWIKTDNIVSGKMYATTASEYLSQLGASVGRKVKAGSVLVACIAGSLSSLGRCCIVDREVAFNQQINAIELYSDKANSKYCYWLITLSSKYIQEFATTGMKHIISKKIFEDIALILPPIEIQQNFAQRIELIEKQKAEIKSTIANLETFLASRMQYWFD